MPVWLIVEPVVVSVAGPPKSVVKEALLETKVRVEFVKSRVVPVPKEIDIAEKLNPFKLSLVLVLITDRKLAPVSILLRRSRISGLPDPRLSLHLKITLPEMS